MMKAKPVSPIRILSTSALNDSKSMVALTMKVSSHPALGGDDKVGCPAQTGKHVADVTLVGIGEFEPRGGRIVGLLEVKRPRVRDLNAVFVDQAEIDKGAVVFLPHQVEHLTKEVSAILIVRWGARGR